MEKIDEYLNVAIDLAKKAGQIILESHRNSKFTVNTKTNVRDLVTEIDIKIERFIFDSLKQRYPEHKFIGEENVDNNDNNDNKITTDEPTWIVDPIDGTMNFAHFSPWCSVSIGLAINKQLVVGVIDCPHLNRTYYAKKNGGAFCNDQPIHVSKIDSIEKSMIQSDIGINYSEKIFNEIYWKCQGYRRIGSCCISLCLIADGSTDIYFMSGIKIWDMAASYVIVKEAGGFITSMNGMDFDININNNILATNNSNLANEIVKILRDIKMKK